MDGKLQAAMEPIVRAIKSTAAVTYLVKFMNLWLFIRRPRKFTNARWADILADSGWNALDFTRHQFYRVYLRYSTKYRYHPQQMRINSQRNIDPSDALAKRMAADGTKEYYNVLPSTRNALAVNCPADLSMHQHCESLRGVIDVVSKLATLSSGDAAEFAAQRMVEGLTREVRVDDYDDWELLRSQIRNMTPDVKLSPESITNDVFPFAVSYKNKEETFISRVHLSRRNGEEDEVVKEEFEQTVKVFRTSDFLDDRRWEQLQRAVREYARAKGYRKVCLWVDRVMHAGEKDEEVMKNYPKLDWVEYGLYAYMLMPTVRVYEPSETQFTTEFWRKVETTLAVSGKGLICDDYVIRKYDGNIYYDESVYRRLNNGIMVIGGKSAYIRSTILAFATMIITDGVAITKANEHPATISSIVQWKSWAMRCITQEAFSLATAVPVANEPIPLDINGFKLLSSWEYDLCNCKDLQNGSYLDMNLQRTTTWSKASTWNGVSEWIGMMGGAYNMNEKSRENVMDYLNGNTIFDMYAAPSGHTAAHIRLTNSTGNVLKSLVVDTARFSTATHGHVIAVADATGHSGKKIVSWFLKQIRDPDNDQKGEITDGQVLFRYEPMKVGLAVPKWLTWILVVLELVIHAIMTFFTFGIWILFLIPYIIWRMSWPWADLDDFGEGLFDNLLLHSVYGSGIKGIYRQIETGDYASIRWK